MQNPISLIRSRLPSSWIQRLPTGLAGASFWLALWFCLLFFLRKVPGGLGTFFAVLQVCVGLALVAVAIPLTLQLIRSRMLWSLRNKLVLTYLLIGLAPVVLFLTLVVISSYIAAGQFSIHLADSRLQAELAQMSGESGRRADVMKQILDGQLPSSAIENIGETGMLESPRLKLHRDIEAFVDGAPVPGSVNLGSASGSSKTGAPELRPRMPLGLPAWATRLQSREFHDLISDGGELFLVAIHQRQLKDGRTLSLMTSLPLSPPLMTMIASGLGVARLQPRSNEAAPDPGRHETRQAKAAIRGESKSSDGAWITGGTEPKAVNVADVGVIFTSTEPMTDWVSGSRGDVLIAVNSRPSLLYNQLFGGSLSGIVASGIRIALILLCVVFALIELLALVMAIRLSRTITTSVADLYQATLQVDRGELNHQIVVKRDDQLAELSRSFNRMTGSLQRLLVEQKEKERLQNELSIAQEVQANLFPHKIHNLKTLELHGVCRPARSVSGDYYDFLLFHEEGSGGRQEAGVAIALGDISGKGISAALLMATLHSAVRAYRFANEELLYSESSVAGLTASKEEISGPQDELFESPGRLLSLLNRHLYRSTQAEKYATLFLAHYDSATAMLTYSNAGQLPPLLLSRDGGIKRLDKGGTVVGLMDGMHYEEGRVQMQSGDIMVAYSDGVTEPENDFGDFGEERLMDVVRRYRDQPLHVISTQVMQALDAWIGAEEQPDDITLVLARQI
jgi:sigma-B regulation protein RsbU (phosphoserine phosphatase)